MITDLLTYSLFPKNADELVRCYLLWLFFFMAVNIIWDIVSRHTPRFHLLRIKDKVGVVMSATSCCSSALLLGSVLDKQTAVVVGGTPVPMVIAGSVGVFLSLASLCPYTEETLANTNS